jgi:hypothetical protein
MSYPRSTRRCNLKYRTVGGSRAAAHLKLLHPGGHVLEVFKILHLLTIIPSFEDETEALASFPSLSCSAKL